MRFLRRLLRLAALFLFQNQAPVPYSVPFMPMRFCSHLVRKGWCAYGDECSFAHFFDEMHPLVAQRELKWPTVGSFGISLADQGLLCLWLGFRGACGGVRPSPPHMSSPLLMCASSSTSSLVLVRSRSRLLVASGSRLVFSCLSRCSVVGRELGIHQPFRGCREGCRHVRACSAVPGSSGSGAWHLPTHCWLPPSRPGSRCDLRRVFLICWSVVVTCSRMLCGGCFGAIVCFSCSVPFWCWRAL